MDFYHPLRSPASFGLDGRIFWAGGAYLSGEMLRKKAQPFYNGIRASRGRRPDPTMERIRLLLVIDYVLVRESLARQLRLDPELEIVEECGAPAAGLDVLSRSPIDVVLLDCDAVRNEAAEFIFAARQAGYEGRILVLASEKDTAGLFKPLRAGASGVFLKHSSLDSLPKAIRQVAAGEAWVDLAVVQLLAGSITERGNPNLDGLLTKRERQVLQGVLDGYTNRIIAEHVGLSEGSAKAILREVFRKAGVRTRSQLVRVALTGPLNTPPSPGY